MKRNDISFTNGLAMGVASLTISSDGKHGDGCYYERCAGSRTTSRSTSPTPLGEPMIVEGNAYEVQPSSQYQAPSTPSTLVRRPGWGSVDTRRAYHDLRSLSASTTASSSTSRPTLRYQTPTSSMNSLANASFSSTTDPSTCDMTVDWGYFVDTPRRP